MQKTLGILITSERHGSHLEAIVRAARRKRIQVCVHINGPAIKLCLKPGFQAALDHTKASICHKAADRFGLKAKLEALYPDSLTSPHGPPLDIGRCRKRIVL